MFTEKEEKAFTIVDSFLKELQDSEDGGMFSTYGEPSEYFLAKEIMDRYNLVTYRAPGSKHSLIDIAVNGVEILKVGGIRAFLSSFKEMADTKEKLEYEKLNGEIIELRNRLFDYDASKRRTVRSEWIAILGLLLSGIAIWISLRSK